MQEDNNAMKKIWNGVTSVANNVKDVIVFITIYPILAIVVSMIPK